MLKVDPANPVYTRETHCLALQGPYSALTLPLSQLVIESITLASLYPESLCNTEEWNSLLTVPESIHALRIPVCLENREIVCAAPLVPPPSKRATQHHTTAVALGCRTHE